ncbi:MAG: GNAT family N-acetyltransferase, partial [Cyanobacteria bacterium]|nr:GNAT family N-acetyltransferase [Cyanobacteriota bacterium]MDW8203216.1 GNAT family N-acetyltransferase [Cyanobacteriota bacterium SKYGB_h_bin112]
MASSVARPPSTIRPIQFHDLDRIEELFTAAALLDAADRGNRVASHLQTIRRWYGVVKVMSFFPNPFQDVFSGYVAEQDNRVCGAIQVMPFNRARTTWRVEQVAVDSGCGQVVASHLLRHCFEAIWEARTWLVEPNINNKDALALYRQNGFQHLAHMTYWSLSPQLLQSLAQREPSLPNLLPVSNADAHLIYQLDTASMPPLVRQVFDRHPHDFKVDLVNSLINTADQWFNHHEVISGYVFEPQRKAAIGYVQLHRCKNGSQPHSAQLTVHPAYTWLYPELTTQMAQMVQVVPPQSLHVTSADYQPEREAYLEQIGADRIAHTLMMSRSIWHKVRETRLVGLENLQLSGVLRGFQPTHKPVPGRINSYPPSRRQP